MLSRAAIKGHPLHPMLIAYPLAFLSGAYLFRIAGLALRRPELTQVSRVLVPAGLGAGLVAAVPGIVDYYSRIPPRSSARRRGVRHALFNTSALGLFAASWLADRPGRHAVPLFLQSLGTAALTAGGALGGTLVYRNQIGVDHRYAGAGRWQEARHRRLHPQHLAEAAAPLGADQMKLVHAEGERVVVARTAGRCVAFSDRCTHRGGPLADGALVNGIVQCPWHGSQFRTDTGQVVCGPADDPIATYPLDERAVRERHAG